MCSGARSGTSVASTYVVRRLRVAGAGPTAYRGGTSAPQCPPAPRGGPPVETTEREYYAALFRRDYGAAQRLYRELARTPHWPADRVVREARKCRHYDAADEGHDGGGAEP